MKITNAGTAGSTYEGDDEHLAKYAFENTESKYWQGSSTYPQYIWFRFHTPRVLAGIEITPYRNAFGPELFQVVGSNDCWSWRTMLGVADSGFPNDLQPGVSKYWDIPRANRLSFYCIGLKIFTIPFGRNRSPELKNIVMWEDAELKEKKLLQSVWKR